MKVTQHLWFETDMEAAVRFYTSLIPGSSIGWMSTIPADTPSGPAGSVKLAGFTLADQRHMAIETGPLDPFNHNFSIIIECDTQTGLHHLWDALKEGGSPEHCGWSRDRSGLSWQITPKRLGELMGDPDLAKAKRVCNCDAHMVEAAASDGGSPRRLSGPPSVFGFTSERLDARIHPDITGRTLMLP